MPREKRPNLRPEDIVVGGLYRAKRFKQGPFGGDNDRVVLWKDQLGVELQYDSDTVGLGRSYPKVSVEAFCRWASHRVNEDGSEWKP